jgi:magnesium chelatase family protein
MTEMGLSARAHDKILRVARTIADIEGQDNIQPHHVAEAIRTPGIVAAAFWQRVNRAA